MIKNFSNWWHINLNCIPVDRYGDATKAMIVLKKNRVHQLESYFMLPEYALALVKCYDVLRDDEKRDKYQAYQLIFK